MKDEDREFEIRTKELAVLVKEQSPMGDIVRRISLKIREGFVNHPPIECGECRECCTAVGVTELNKPGHKSCVHECDSGCSIYSIKPPSCTDFDCLWKRHVIGNGEQRFRPDRIGMVPIIQDGIHFGPVMVCFMETRPGSAINKDAQELIDMTRKQFPVTFGTGDGSKTALYANEEDFYAITNYLAKKNKGYTIVKAERHTDEQGS